MEHTLVIDINRQLHAMGSNTLNQLGIKDLTKVLIPVPLEAVGKVHFEDVFCHNLSLAVDTKQKLFLWGTLISPEGEKKL